MTNSYEVEITLGSHTFTVASTDPGIEETITVLDDLRIGWSAPTGQPWPWQPEPVECRVKFFTRDTANLADVDITTPMQIKVTSGGTLVAAFAGRVSDLDAHPHRLADGDLVMFFDVTGVDYVVDANEVNIDLARPEEDASERVPAICALIAAAGGPTFDIPVLRSDWTFEAIDSDQVPGLDALLDHLRQMPEPGALLAPGRMLVVPATTGGVFDDLSLQWLAFETAASWPPLGFALDGSTLVIDTHADPPADLEGLPIGLVIDSGRVYLDGIEWTRNKFTSVNVVTVKGPTATVTVTRDGTSTISGSSPPTVDAVISVTNGVPTPVVDADSTPVTTEFFS